MHHAVPDAVEPGLAANVSAKPVVYCGDRPLVALRCDRLVGERATAGILDRQARRVGNSLHLTMHARRQRAVVFGLEHREFNT